MERSAKIQSLHVPSKEMKPDRDEVICLQQTDGKTGGKPQVSSQPRAVLITHTEPWFFTFRDRFLSLDTVEVLGRIVLC